ncbi:MAG: response regulator transcription factor [Defluviitaleaceae bacterium]|nr:response regulator transcription factor [Defluviitaleaceae bacterium]
MLEQKSLILIVEDDEEMAHLNERLLNRKGYHVLLALTAAEARLLAEKNNFDLMILDIGLPDEDGITLCGDLRKVSDAPILFLTGRNEAEDKIAGLDKGGDYYLTKPYDRSVFMAVVQSLLRRAERNKKRIDELSEITRGSLTIKIRDKKALINGRDAELTSKEFAVLLLLVQNEDKEISNEQIYKTVWGTEMNNDANAVRLQISRLKKKLDESNAEDFAIYTEYGFGYIFVSNK